MNKDYLRPAECSDISFLFHLANDEECRKNSFHPEQIEFQSHEEWFYKKLHSKSCRLYIYINEIGEPIGQARLDKEGNGALISYSIAKEHRGKGYGEKIIKLLEMEATKYSDIEYLYAKVRYENTASNHIFNKMNYSVEESTNCLQYIKRIQ